MSTSAQSPPSFRVRRVEFDCLLAVVSRIEVPTHASFASSRLKHEANGYILFRRQQCCRAVGIQNCIRGVLLNGLSKLVTRRFIFSLLVQLITQSLQPFCLDGVVFGLGCHIASIVLGFEMGRQGKEGRRVFEPWMAFQKALRSFVLLDTLLGAGLTSCSR